MLSWLLAIGGLVLAVAAVVLLIVAMRQADRRARRSLFRALGLADETVELLMSRNGDVLAEVTLVRRHAPHSAADEARAPSETLLRRAQPAIRFLHPIEGGAADPGSTPAAAEPLAPAAGRRRLPHPGRQGRP
jgi:hypothetical protein